MVNLYLKFECPLFLLDVAVMGLEVSCDTRFHERDFMVVVFDKVHCFGYKPVQ